MVKRLRQLLSQSASVVCDIYLWFFAVQARNNLLPYECEWSGLRVLGQEGQEEIVNYCHMQRFELGPSTVQVRDYDAVPYFFRKPFCSWLYFALQVTSFRGSATFLGEIPPWQNSNSLWEIEEFYIKLLLSFNKTVDSRRLSQHWMFCICYSSNWVSASELLWHLHHINPFALKAMSLGLTKHSGDILSALFFIYILIYSTKLSIFC